jgi:hypothetical protein
LPSPSATRTTTELDKPQHHTERPSPVPLRTLSPASSTTHYFASVQQGKALRYSSGSGCSLVHRSVLVSTFPENCPHAQMFPCCLPRSSLNSLANLSFSSSPPRTVYGGVFRIIMIKTIIPPRWVSWQAPLPPAVSLFHKAGSCSSTPLSIFPTSYSGDRSTFSTLFSVYLFSIRHQKPGSLIAKYLRRSSARELGVRSSTTLLSRRGLCSPVSFLALLSRPSQSRFSIPPSLEKTSTVFHSVHSKLEASISYLPSPYPARTSKASSSPSRPPTASSFLQNPSTTCASL